METEVLTFLLGTSVAVIAVLVAGLGVALRRNGSSNPNLDTMDTKLNTILIVLTRIEAKMGGKSG